MDIQEMAERVASNFPKMAKESYREYFEQKMKDWGISSPAELDPELKDNFFEDVDEGWTSEAEE